MERNNIGLAGFVLAICGLIFSWVPYLGWIVWLVGAILSIIGLFKNPRGFAVAGTIISFIGVIVLLLFFGIVGCAAFMYV